MNECITAHFLRHVV